MSLSQLLAVAAAALGTVVGFGILVRAHRSVADWSFLGLMLAAAAESFCFWEASKAGTLAPALAWSRGQLVASAPLGGFALVFSLTFARGNAADGLKRWAGPIFGGFVLPIVLLSLAWRSTVAAEGSTQEGARMFLRLGWSGVGCQLVLLASTVLMLMNLEKTFRAAVGTMRWRIKFMLLGMGLLGVVRLYTSSQAVLFRTVDPTLGMLNSMALVVAIPLIIRSLMRTWSLDTDVYPSQSVLQGSVALLLAGIYLVGVGAFAKLAAMLGGDATFALKAFFLLIALVALAILLQSDRVRLRLRQFVSRHFQRPLYDYRTVWRKFTEATASRVEQTELCRSLVGLIADMFQALSVSIWLVDDGDRRLALAGSTSLPVARAHELAPSEAETAALAGLFERNHEPSDLETNAEPETEILRRIHPSEFPNGGHRVCAPLVLHGKLLGVVLVGDRVSGFPFSLQDFDVLRCAAEHATASLHNVKLSQKLLQSKEMEAFQTMATFFVHDLKNAASTLNLMLKNLPVHFDDPEFREDALRGIGKSVAHINRLIARLGTIRNELKIQPMPADLNDVVMRSLAGPESATQGVISRDLGMVPPVQVDREQIQKVFTNLVMNAIEALPKTGGQIKVSSGQSNGWAVVSFEDNGCGMSPEFVERSLYRPFQTTKQTGLGIGMFQSKMILEAHGGRFTVSSELGKGTTFQVFLPLAKSS